MNKQKSYIHRVKYFSVITRNELLMHDFYIVDETWKTSCCVKENSHRRPNILWILLSEMSRVIKSQRQSKLVAARGWKEERVGWWLMGKGNFGGEVWKYFKIGWWWWLCNSVNILKVTDLYTSEEWVLCYVIYILIRMLYRKNISIPQSWKVILL